MKPFEYASPTRADQAVELLGSQWGTTEILAGGTDLLALMKDAIVTPDRLVNVKTIDGLSEISYSAGEGLKVGATCTLAELARNPDVNKHYPALSQAINDAASPQIRNRATVAGNLCQRPRCWYFRNGYGLLALDPSTGASLVVQGENRYHAILGNQGPAYFVSPSTVAPTLIALGARIVIAGPTGATRAAPLEDFFRIPADSTEREHDLAPNEIVVEVRVPPPHHGHTAYYEVRQKHAFDWPVATATVLLEMRRKTVTAAHVVLGQVAPIPWRSPEAEAALLNQRVTPALASAVGLAAVSAAKSLSQNGYKIPVAAVTVQRAVLLAAELDPYAT
jgi:xanthine dehydrogenase YagS FAD-binding subunit